MKIIHWRGKKAKLRTDTVVGFRGQRKKTEIDITSLFNENRYSIIKKKKYRQTKLIQTGCMECD